MVKSFLLHIEKLLGSFDYHTQQHYPPDYWHGYCHQNWNYEKLLPAVVTVTCTTDASFYGNKIYNTTF